METAIGFRLLATTLPILVGGFQALLAQRQQNSQLPKPADRGAHDRLCSTSHLQLAEDVRMWLLIVFVDNPSLVAIAELDSPEAISSTTSRSRRVSSAKAGSRGVLRA